VDYSDNPAVLKGNLENLLPKLSQIKAAKHHPALPYNQVAQFLTDLRTRQTNSARALELAILTCSRSGEVRGATWAEIDLQAKQWTIPKERMKARKEHVVPLSDSAVTLLKLLKKNSPKNELVFPGSRGSQMSDMTLSKLIKAMHEKQVEKDKVGYVDPSQGRNVVTPHGFRSTFRDWAAEQSPFPREVIEHALAHQLKDKAEAAYQRGSALPKRVKLMQAWANFCNQVDAATVINMRVS